MGVFEALGRKVVSLVLGEGDGEVTLYLTAMDAREYAEWMKKGDGEDGLLGPDFTLYGLYVALRRRHEGVTYDEVMGGVTMDQLPAVEAAMRGVLPERPTDVGVIECPGCRLRVPFEIVGGSVRVRVGVSNFVAG